MTAESMVSLSPDTEIILPELTCNTLYEELKHCDKLFPVSGIACSLHWEVNLSLLNNMPKFLICLLCQVLFLNAHETFPTNFYFVAKNVNLTGARDHKNKEGTVFVNLI